MPGQGRPCTCEREGCRLCWLYHNDPQYRDLWDGKPVEIPKPRVVPLFGNMITASLKAVGVTEERVAKLVGGCGCSERRRRLNSLDEWARNAIKNNAKTARSWLENLVQSWTESPKK
jgi:hypothetical protein